MNEDKETNIKEVLLEKNETNTHLNMDVKLNQPPVNPYVTDESEHSLDSGMIDKFIILS